jgi:hypothetical protein
MPVASNLSPGMNPVLQKSLQYDVERNVAPSRAG